MNRRQTLRKIGAVLLITVAGVALPWQLGARSSRSDQRGGPATSGVTTQGLPEGLPERLPDDALAVKVVGYEGERAILNIRNQTPFVVLVYIRGIRVGWLRPHRTGLIRGLKVGYHQVYAHSRWGSASWGPRLLWVPSTWTLFR